MHASCLKIILDQIDLQKNKVGNVHNGTFYRIPSFPKPFWHYINCRVEINVNNYVFLREFLILKIITKKFCVVHINKYLKTTENTFYAIYFFTFTTFSKQKLSFLCSKSMKINFLNEISTDLISTDDSMLDVSSFSFLQLTIPIMIFGFQISIVPSLF